MYSRARHLDVGQKCEKLRVRRLCSLGFFWPVYKFSSIRFWICIMLSLSSYPEKMCAIAALQQRVGALAPRFSQPASAQRSGDPVAPRGPLHDPSSTNLGECAGQSRLSLSISLSLSLSPVSVSVSLSVSCLSFSLSLSLSLSLFVALSPCLPPSLSLTLSLSHSLFFRQGYGHEDFSPCLSLSLSSSSSSFECKGRVMRPGQNGPPFFEPFGGDTQFPSIVPRTDSSISLSLSPPLSLYLALSLSLFPSLSLSLSLFFLFCMYMCIHSPSIYLSIYLSVDRSIQRYTCA